MIETLKTNSFFNDTNKFKIPNVNLEFTSNENNDNILNNDEFIRLNFYKSKIDELDDTNDWDEAKKISNLYELIYLPNKKFKSDSISRYEPLSRSYFKLWEIINDFDLLGIEKNLKFASIAEGPGGFIEAIINYRKKYKVKDTLYAITLKSVNKDIPGWNKATNFLRKNQNVNITYGADNTGNIYKLENIKAFRSNFDGDAHLVTADGGFDFSFNFNKQEQMSYRIIFCEIVMALSIQQKGGHFVCKFFDMYTKITLSFLYLLVSLYDKVHVTKPLTSRPANSEKYIVCKGFKGIDENYLNKLFIIINSWDYIEENKMELVNIFDNINTDYFDKIRLYNTKYFNIQISSIESTLNYINNKCDKEKQKQIKKQVTAAFSWCKQYRCKINYNSSYLIKK
jgi:23S rRNA U2552 (ribose-2'-O)-methylase RlmE/FtsJ